MAGSTITCSRLGRLGRLGNQLFQIAGSLAVARRQDAELSLPPWSYAPYFSVPPEVFAGPRGQESFRYVNWLRAAAPYLQDYRLVTEVEGTIRQWFLPGPGVAQLELRLPAAPPLCAVHVRRTDMLKYPRHYQVPTAEWYERAMSVIRDRDPQATFVVFTDDVDWSADNLPGVAVASAPTPADYGSATDADGHPLPHPTEMHDLWAMTLHCRHHIVANSAFSWWAAWLSGDPSPIVPARWYGPAYAELDETHLLPPDWTVL